MNHEVAEFVAHLLHSSTVTHFMHWSTNNNAKHEALGRYYAKIIKLVDRFAEAYMGKYDQLKKFPDEFHVEKDPLKYMQNMQEFVEESRKELPQDTELQNLVDEIAELINSTLYPLKYLE
jgi:DNA-binding ferritin-like protein